MTQHKSHILNNTTSHILKNNVNTSAFLSHKPFVIAWASDFLVIAKFIFIFFIPVFSLIWLRITVLVWMRLRMFSCVLFVLKLSRWLFLRASIISASNVLVSLLINVQWLSFDWLLLLLSVITDCNSAMYLGGTYAHRLIANIVCKSTSSFSQNPNSKPICFSFLVFLERLPCTGHLYP